LKPRTYQGKHEFFLDVEGLIYRRRSNDKHQLIVPNTLVADVIRENHDPVYIAHPGVKRTYELIALSGWEPGMRKAVKEYIKKCDACQRMKKDREIIAPLGEVDRPNAPFQVTSVDITGPYPVTPHRNRYLLTFIDHYRRYAEAFPIPDQKAETCAQVYATQIVTRHGSGSKLISDQGPAFMSAFFNETCKILGIRRARTSSYHPASNGTVERLHRSLHTSLSHYVNPAHNNWDVLVPFFLMAQRATPRTATGYSPFFLLHGREMTLPSNEDLKAKIPITNRNLKQQMEKLKASLMQAYEVTVANRHAHQTNKRYYDRRAKRREFKTGE